MSLILSCEHASAHVPARYALAFRGQAAQRALGSHRGVDFGALPLARELARSCGAPLFSGRQTRLLIDLNRTSRHAALFSTFSSHLPAKDLEHLRSLHAAHFQELDHRVRASGGPVIHVAVHSFTPVLSGKRRDFDVGLLYDPSRTVEVELALQLREALSARGLRVRRNAPYRGVADGLPTWLRRRFPAQRYAGIELEVNQAMLWPKPHARKRRELLLALTTVLRERA